jgi:predicted double-glycine peptidase
VPKPDDTQGKSTSAPSPSTVEQKIRLEFERQEAENSYHVSNSPQAKLLSGEELMKSRHRRDGSLGKLGSAMQKASDHNRLRREFANNEGGPEGLVQGRRALEISREEAQSWTPQHNARRREIPLIWQARPNACGDSCMQMVLAYFNKYHTNEGTNDRPFYQGLMVDEIESKLEDRALLVARLKPSQGGKWTLKEISEFTEMYGPLIAIGHGHAVVIAGIEGDSVLIHDPLLGKKKSTIVQLNKWIDQDADVPVMGFSQAQVVTDNAEECALAAEPGVQASSISRMADRAVLSVMKATGRLVQ